MLVPGARVVDLLAVASKQLKHAVAEPLHLPKRAALLRRGDERWPHAQKRLELHVPLAALALVGELGTCFDTRLPEEAAALARSVDHAFEKPHGHHRIS